MVTLAAVCAQIGAQIRTFMNAGYETTASALAFTVANVAAAPAAETRLLREVDAFGRESVPTYEDLDKVGIAYCTSPQKNFKTLQFECFETFPTKSGSSAAGRSCLLFKTIAAG